MTPTPSEPIKKEEPKANQKLQNIPDSHLNVAIKSPSDMYFKYDNIEAYSDAETLKKSPTFDDMPGPTVLKYLSKMWTLIPVIGNQVTASSIQYLLSAGKIFGKIFSLDLIINLKF